MADPRKEIRKRIVRRLKGDDWMEKHFGIACHAGDVADAVLELFEEIEIEELGVVEGQRLTHIRVLGQPPSTRIVLRTTPEEAP